MEIADLYKTLFGLLLPVALLVVLVFANEAGFEGFIAKPIIARYVPAIKHLQPFLVLAFAGLFAYGLNIDVIAAINKVYPLIDNGNPDMTKLISTILVTLLSMSVHKSAPIKP